MSIELMILSAVVIVFASFAMFKPAVLFEYPVATSMLMAFFILPQAWRIEAEGDLNDFTPTLTWFYMIMCVLMTQVGFRFGTAGMAKIDVNTLATLKEKYDFDRIFIGATALVGIGTIALIFMIREGSNLKEGEAWSGPIAFYQMISNFLLYGGGLAWILFLHTRIRRIFLLALFSLCINIPAIIFFARRELIFVVFTTIFASLFFIRKKSIGRIIVIPSLMIGSILINQTSAIRGYILTNKVSILEALSSDDVRNTKAESTEVSGAVSDIAIASWTKSYQFFIPYVNTLTHLYVPAFIFGHDTKDSLKISVDDDYTGSRYFANGATRTGFAESFQSFHYFGCLVFFFISYFMGILWKRAKTGDIEAQIYYPLFLATGLKVFTESTSIFIGVAPLIFGSIGLVFLYAKRRVPGTQAEGPTLSHQIG